jgi:hypothetical protein
MKAVLSTNFLFSGEPSIIFDPPSPPIQYVFNVSEVLLAWHYKVSFIFCMQYEPIVKPGAHDLVGRLNLMKSLRVHAVSFLSDFGQ